MSVPFSAQAVSAQSPQEISQNETLLHFWVFDGEMTNNFPLETIDSTYSLPGFGQIEFQSARADYPFGDGDWDTASMERRNAPTDINYRPAGNDNIAFEDANMRGMQVRQPFQGDGGENTLIFHLPTTGYESVVFRFAARDEGAAETLIVDYSTATDDAEWTTDGLDSSMLPLYDEFQLYTVEFDALSAVDNNADFKIRLRFAGPDMAVDDGNRVTFNNISLDGSVMEGGNLPPVVSDPPGLATLIEGGAPGVFDLTTFFEDPEDDPMTFSAQSDRPDRVGAVISGAVLTVTPTLAGDAHITIEASDGNNPPVPANFRVLVYPQAYALQEGTFAFTEWDPDTPELVYPDHILFLQSDMDDPGIDAPLLYPYYIEHNDYHADDFDTIGFPYRLTGRTRLNGLGDAGIAFINTGRGRDLGGLLLALDTRGVSVPAVDWVGGTLLPNSRDYSIRLQYRIGIEGEFTDVTVGGAPVEYRRSELENHVERFEAIALPQALAQQEYVQLLWRYYHVEGDSGPRAQLRLDDIAVYTEPNPVLTLNLEGTGSGRVTSVPPGIDCGSACSAGFLAGQEIMLEASAAPLATFSGWTGVCAGQGPVCTFTLEADTSVAAQFEESGDGFLFLPYVYSGPNSNLVINEFMSSNGETIADENGDFPDWIEIYNRGSQPVALNGVGLSDDPNRPFRWEFPNVTLDGGEFLLVWASGKDRAHPQNALHTNFSISAEGEPLLLTHPDGTLLEWVPPVGVPRDVSYGRWPDGSGEWRFFDTPTPGWPNLAQEHTEVLEPPVFSHTGGFYVQDFLLTLSSGDPDATIIYTLDGSEPEPNNLAGTTYFYKQLYPTWPGMPFGDFHPGDYRSILYQSPIAIVDRSDAPNELPLIATTYYADQFKPVDPVPKATVVRARAVKPGAIASEIETHTFFVTPHLTAHESGTIAPYRLPIIALSLPETHLFDYEDGLYIPGVDFDQWRTRNPDIGATGGSAANYHRDTEYTAHMEMFEVAPVETVIKQDIGVRIHGSWSRALPQKSLRLYARNRYRAPTFDYPIFQPDGDHGFSRLMLRNSGQDDLFTRFRDAFVQSLIGHLNIDTQAFRPAIVFINGEYWGIHNIRERYDKHYLAREYHVDAENIDLLTGRSTVKEGDALHYNATLEYIERHGLENPVHYAHVQTRIDVDSFMDFQIAHIYINNTDWPNNNVDYWRLRTPTYFEDNPPGQDGRWRWLFYDADLGFGFNDLQAFRFNTLEHATSIGVPVDGVPPTNPAWATFLLRHFLHNATFRVEFINRFADLMNTAFLPSHVLDVMSGIKQHIEPEMPQHIARWNRPANMETWNAYVDLMRVYAHERPAYQRAHIREKFGIAQDVAVTLNVSNPAHGHIRINTVAITPQTPGVGAIAYPWRGLYFEGIPITLTAIPAAGCTFSGWQEFPNISAPRLEITPTTNIAATALFGC